MSPRRAHGPTRSRRNWGLVGSRQLRAALVQHQLVDRHLLRREMRFQIEPFCEQRLQHELRLFFPLGGGHRLHSGEGLVRDLGFDYVEDAAVPPSDPQAKPGHNPRATRGVEGYPD